MADRELGLYPKYRVFKMDEHMPDGPIEVEVGPGSFDQLTEVEDPCFVLKFDDQDAHEALLVYADAVEYEYPQLAKDLRMKIANIRAGFSNG